MAKTYRYAKYKIDYVREQSFTLDVHKLKTRDDVRGIACGFLSESPLEQIVIIAVNASGRVIGIDTIQGAANQCPIIPQNVFRFLLSIGASSFFVAHNHPGGETLPSEQDWKVTKKLKNCGRELDIPLLDHVIITEKHTTSMRESNRWN